MNEAAFDYMPFAQVPTRAFFDKGLTETDFRVLGYVASLTVNRNRRAWMSQQKLADRLEVSKRTVQRCLYRLQDLGYLQIESNGRSGPARRNHYYIIHEHNDDT